MKQEYYLPRDPHLAGYDTGTLKAVFESKNRHKLEPTTSRRNFLKDALYLSLAAGVASSTGFLIDNRARVRGTGSRIDSLTNLESQEIIIGNYSLEASRVVGEKYLVGIATFYPDENKHIVIGDIDPSVETVVLRDIGTVPFYPVSVTISETNPDIIVAVGESTKGSDQGAIGFTKDGGKTPMKVIKDDKGKKSDAQITPDGTKAYISETNHYQTSTLMAHLDLANETVTHKVVSDMQPGQGIGFLTKLQPSKSGAYENYSTSDSNLGYTKLIHSQDTVQAQLQNTQEGLTSYPPVQFKNSSGDTIILFFNNETPIGMIYKNVNDIKKENFQPNSALYPEPSAKDTLVVLDAAVDFQADKLFLVTSTQDQNGIYNGHVEVRSYSQPNDVSYDKNYLLTNEGLPQHQNNNDNIIIGSIESSSINNQMRLITSAERIEYAYDPKTNRKYFVFKEGGGYLCDPYSLNPWKKIYVKTVSHITTPTPTPTIESTPIPTPTPTIESTPIPTPTPTKTPIPLPTSTPIPDPTPVYKFKRFIPLASRQNR